MGKAGYVILILTLLSFSMVMGQDDDSLFNSDTTFYADSARAVDTLLFRQFDLLSKMAPVTNPENFEKHLNQNPTIGLFKSMFVPGWGQFGNKKYIKATLFFGLDVWFVGSAIHYGSQASDYKKLYDDAVDLSTRNYYYNLYSDKKEQRNKYTWFAAIVSFISMFDAYVDAHLSGYPEQKKAQELSFDVKPLGFDGAMATVSLSF